nr:MAG TPA: hypothetical protein [Caudoviricetes sp.]
MQLVFLLLLYSNIKIDASTNFIFYILIIIKEVSAWQIKI